ncbi:MAG TPA: DbpA RNA binding domain-containing protein [Gemmatimonadaceae bacterium]|nr:DbpA RNA binding domain-containing protein [Gemmatimonadaceae bacterium]
MTRGQNAVHLMPLDWSAAERVVATLVDRIDVARVETQLLVVTADAESAAAAAEAIVHAAGGRAVRVIAATSSPRAARLLKGSPAHVVAGAPAELAALLQGSALKPESVRGVVFAWLDPILGTADATPLETLLGELPKEGARVVLAAELTPALEALIERYARRARRAVEPAADAAMAPLNAEYVATAGTARAVTLRRLLDALDLPRAVLYARSETIRADAQRVARSLGYPADAVRVSAEGDEPSGDPLVLVELPTSREELRALVGTSGRRIYAVVQLSQLPSLRGLLGGGTVAPVALLDAAERARGKDAAMRSSLRDVLASGDVRREVLALEPLLAEFDGIEIAAAALRILEQQRPARPAAAAAAQSQPMQRLFVNLGEKDGIRAQEIITAITTEAGIPGSQVGKVEVRDTHSLVEVAASVAELVAGKITGSVVRGRRVQARLDTPREDRPARSAPPVRGDRPARSFSDRGDRGERPPRSGPPRGDRPERGDRPARPSYDKGDRGDRPARSGPPRGASPRSDRPDRPARPFNAVRKFDRDGGAGGTGRPTRPRPRRDDA